MPFLDYIEKLTGIKEEWIQNLKETESALVLAVQLPPQEHIRPHCKAATRRIKGCYTRLIKHFPLLHKELHLLYRQRRYICSCGHTFNEKSPFASPYFHTSSSLQQVMLQELRQHLSFQEAARRCHVSTSQVIRVFNEVHIPRPSHLPRVLSIDECKGNAAGQKYQVIITDSEAKRIMVILPARTTNGFTEGCNNKIKVVKRISFGLRNFERFRHRILYINTRNEKGHALSFVHVLFRRT